MSSDEMKRQAARAALRHLPDEGVLGLGTGSTTRFFIEAVGELVRGGRAYTGVPTSIGSRRLAEACGIPLLTDDGPWPIDVCVDGADEVSPTLDLIKGGGGAHTREKVVSNAAKRNVIIVDETKLVARLGQTRKVPLEVLSFGYRTTLAALSPFGTPELRLVDGAPLRSDAGNFIVDLATGELAHPSQLDQALQALPGVVGTGLFLGRADVVVVAGSSGIRELARKN
ncbi:MAG: ribose-5-phosphate isomerase [Polyangiaceae bacterium]|jgi:ribose 5-phosphate isomerase A|nr:ribose-5-phosphate isomerase [Polyangiaceae bacterium]